MAVREAGPQEEQCGRVRLSQLAKGQSPIPLGLQYHTTTELTTAPVSISSVTHIFITNNEVLKLRNQGYFLTKSWTHDYILTSCQ